MNDVIHMVAVLALALVSASTSAWGWGGPRNDPDYSVGDCLGVDQVDFQIDRGYGENVLGRFYGFQYPYYYGYSPYRPLAPVLPSEAAMESVNKEAQQTADEQYAKAVEAQRKAAEHYAKAVQAQRQASEQYATQQATAFRNAIEAQRKYSEQMAAQLVQPLAFDMGRLEVPENPPFEPLDIPARFNPPGYDLWGFDRPDFQDVKVEIESRRAEFMKQVETRRAEMKKHIESRRAELAQDCKT